MSTEQEMTCSIQFQYFLTFLEAMVIKHHVTDYSEQETHQTAFTYAGSTTAFV
jgi:hypothetical protein